MKFSLLAFALFSTTVFAIGTNELTGSFEVSDKIPSVESDARFLTGATSVEAADKTRSPASAEENKNEISHVTEMTGSFR